MTEMPLSALDTDALPLNRATHLRLSVGRAPDGMPIEIPVSILSGRARHPRVLFTAGVHGDEFEGVRALTRICHELDAAELSGTAVIVPLLNPPAYNGAWRSSPIDAQNLNRLFPGNPDGSFSERLAFQVTHYLLPGADLLVDFHTGGVRLLHSPLACYYAGSGEINRLSLSAAVALGLDNAWSVPHRHGVLSYAAIEAGIPAVGAELGGGARCEADNVERYRQSALNVLRVWGVLPGRATDFPAPRRVTGDWLQAPVSGYLENHVALNQSVRAGDELAQVYDWQGRSLACLAAPCDGWVLGLRTYPPVYAGDPATFVLAAGDMPAVPAAV